LAKPTTWQLTQSLSVLRVVLHERVERVRVVGELPGLVLRLVTDAARLAARITLRAQQHRHGCACELRHPHPEQWTVDVGAPATRAVRDPSVLVDHDQIGDACERSVGRLDLPAVVEQHREEVELVVLEGAPHFVRSTGQLEPDEQRALVLRHLCERGLQELECLVTVRAGVQEEQQQHRAAAHRGEVELVLSGRERWR
jgi:hypothetical protein